MKIITTMYSLFVSFFLTLTVIEINCYAPFSPFLFYPGFNFVLIPLLSSHLYSLDLAIRMLSQ